MNKQLKIIENKILALKNELENVQGGKQAHLEQLAKANPLWMQLDTSEQQIIQRIAEHNNFKKTLEDMINGQGKSEEPTKRRKRTIDPEPEEQDKKTK
ncbi:MAG: hypothetical protein HeimC3_40900 [Candidatus Heimdallarchaeota archaeon LC_3]|nr:MAG: hypothetical protein HeimC3_40900 [Candidatus Heimdallarchaeota archaeon LC_3]